MPLCASVHCILLKITPKCQTISNQLLHMYNQDWNCTAKMTGQRRVQEVVVEEPANEVCGSGHKMEQCAGSHWASFRLPMTKEHSKRVFSQLKLIKINGHTAFKEDTLNQLLQTNLEASSLGKWDQLCWKEKTRRVYVNQKRSSSTSCSRWWVTACCN